MARVATLGAFTHLAQQGVTVSLDVPVTVAGIVGRGGDFEVAPNASPPLVLYTGDPLGGYGVAPGTKGHLIELVVAGTPVAIEYDATQADFPALQKIAEPMIASISFAP